MNEQYMLWTAFISVYKPHLVNILRYFTTNKIKDEQTKKSANFILALFLSFIIAITVKYVGNYDISILEMLLMGTGSYATGQSAYRLNKVNYGKSIEELKSKFKKGE